jgi:predicted dehydrogenase
MWTRFFPAVEQARRLVFGNGTDSQGVIGEVVAVITEFNFNASDSEEYPTSFFYNRKLGGGASYLAGAYPFAAATLFFGGAQPDTIKAVGQVDEKTGVDLQAAVIMTFPPTSNVPPALDPDQTLENTPKLPG